MIDDRTRDLDTVLSYLVGRRLRAVELADALGVSRSSYYAAREEGRLINADNLLRFANALDLNPVDLLVRYGLITDDAITEYATQNAAGLSPATARPSRKTPRLKPREDLPPL